MMTGDNLPANSSLSLNPRGTHGCPPNDHEILTVKACHSHIFGKRNGFFPQSNIRCIRLTLLILEAVQHGRPRPRPRSGPSFLHACISRIAVPLTVPRRRVSSYHSFAYRLSILTLTQTKVIMSLTMYALGLLKLFQAVSATVSDFQGPQTVTSRGGKATCLVGPLRVSVTATNTKLLYQSPASQPILTNTINEFLVPGGNFTTAALGGPSQVSGTYRIHSKLCWPSHSRLEGLKSVQLLTHGGSLTEFYWDIGPGYSFVDAAAEAGYATFSYDRLGSGESDRPDPIAVVQGSIQVEILHELVTALRQGSIGGHGFQQVIGNSHSLACLLTVGQAHRYPEDLDAVILTGTSITPDYIGASLAGAAYVRASEDVRFSTLSGGYILYVGAQAVQLNFFKHPYYDEAGKK